MKHLAPSATSMAITSITCAVLAACGGGGGPEKAIASAMSTPVTDVVAGTSATSVNTAADSASAPASAAASSPAMAVALSATRDVTVKAAAAPAPTTKVVSPPAAAPSPAPSPAPTPAAAPAPSPTTASTPKAPPIAAGTINTSTGVSLVTTTNNTQAPAAAPAAAPTAAPAVATAPARQSPLWNLPADSASAAKTMALTGMSLLTSTSTGLFNGARTAREDWPGLVAKAKSDSTVQSWLKTEQTRIDAWMSRNFERADLLGGWTGDYIDPATNLPLTWQPTDPEPKAVTTDAQKKFKAAWVALGRDYNIAQMQAAARLYRAGGDAKYAEWAAKQLDFYAKQYSLWPVNTPEGRATLYRQGLDEAVASFALVDTARLLEAYAGSTRAATWRNNLFMPMAVNLKSTSAPKSNIQLWHASAIAAIAMRYRDATLLDYAINDAGGIKANMAAGLTADNLWVEGTFSYNTYVLSCLSKLLVAAGLEGYADRFTAEADASLRMVMAPVEYRFDDGSIPNPGDSTSAQVAINDLPHWYLFRVMPTYWGVAKATAWRTWESLLDPPTPNKSATPPTVPAASTHNFESLRWTVLRAGTWQAFVRYGGMLANHWADEAFNFELRQGATAIAVDPGTVIYGSPYHAGYFQRGPAANAPLVDGDNQRTSAAGTLKSFDIPTSTISAEQPAFQSDAVVGRTVRLTSSGFVEQTTLRIPSGKTRRLGATFSSTCDMVPGSGVTAASGQAALPAVTAFGYWSNTTTYTTSAAWQLTLKCPGGKNYLMQVWGPGAQRLYIGKAPNTPMPSTRNSLYYEVSGSSAVFESSITAQ